MLGVFDMEGFLSFDSRGRTAEFAVSLSALRTTSDHPERGMLSELKKVGKKVQSNVPAELRFRPSRFCPLSPAFPWP